MNLTHGESFISFDGDIITVKANGAFNREGVIEAFEKLRLLIENHHFKKFKILFDYLECHGGTPEAFEVINQSNIWLNNQNMIAKAVVINSPAINSILEARTVPKYLTKPDQAYAIDSNCTSNPNALWLLLYE
jgi:hypothetical protein